MSHVAIYVSRKLYFIFTVSRVNIFHSSLNGSDHFDTTPKD